MREAPRRRRRLSEVERVQALAWWRAGVGCGFRMLEPQEELKPGIGFDRGYIVLGNKRDSTQQIGQAVCPPVAAALVGRLVEAWRRGGKR